MRGCIEQLQTVEKEVRSLQVSRKELADLKDHLDDKNIERSELKLRYEVGQFRLVWQFTKQRVLLHSVLKNNCPTLTTSSSEHNGTQKRKRWQASGQLTGSSANTTRWRSNVVKTTSKSKNSEQKQMHWRKRFLFSQHPRDLAVDLSC